MILIYTVPNIILIDWFFTLKYFYSKWINKTNQYNMIINIFVRVDHFLPRSRLIVDQTTYALHKKNNNRSLKSR